MKILDVGCGDTAVGDVNCDLYVEDKQGHRGTIGERCLIDSKKIKNFVKCDGSYLPFKSGTFDLALSRQVIEHAKNPQLFFSELCRVSRDMIVVETVHRRGERPATKKDKEWCKKHHINKFDYSYFKKLGSLFHCFCVKCETLSYTPLPSGFMPLIKAPFEIRVVFSKNHETLELAVLNNSCFDFQRRYLVNLSGSL